MTAPDIPRLMALAEAATPGPRRLTLRPDHDECDTYYYIEAGEGILWVREKTEMGFSLSGVISGSDAAFIAAADPDTILALCRRLKNAEAAVDRVLTSIEAYVDAIDERDGGYSIIHDALEKKP